MKHHLNFAVSLHGNRLWNSKYHYGIKHDMKLENSVHGNLSRNNTFPSVMKYHMKLEVLHSWNSNRMPGQCFLWIFLQTNECQGNSIFLLCEILVLILSLNKWVHFYMCCSQVPGCLYSQHVRYKGAKSHCRWSRSWTWSSFDYMAHGSDPTPVWPATILTHIDIIISFTYCFVLVLANN